MKGIKVTAGRRLLAFALTVLMFASGNVQVFAQVVDGTLANLERSTHTIRVTTDEIAAAIARGQSEDFTTEELEIAGVKTELVGDMADLETPSEDESASFEDTAEPEAPASSDAQAPASSEAGAPASSDAQAPASSEAGAPASSDAQAPASSEAGAPASSDAQAPASSEAGAPASSDAQAPASSEAGAPASSEAQAPASSEAGAPETAPAAPEATAPADNGGASNNAPAAAGDGGSTGGDSAPAGGSDNGGSAGGSTTPAAATLGSYIRFTEVQDSGAVPDNGSTEPAEPTKPADATDIKVDNREDHTYTLDPAMKEVLESDTLHIPLESVTFKQEIGAIMEGKLLVKYFEALVDNCETCQAIVAIDPASGELVAIGINSGEESHGFKLQVVDAQGNPVELSDVKSVVSTAVQKELSGEELAKLLSETAKNENKELEVTQVVVDPSVATDNNSSEDAAAFEEETTAPVEKDNASPDASAPASSEAGSAASPDASAPASSEAGSAASPDASAPASSEAGSAASSDASAPASSEAQAPASSEAAAPETAPAAPEATAPADNGGASNNAPAAAGDGGSTGGDSAPAGGSDNGGGSAGGSTTPAAATLGSYIRFEGETADLTVATEPATANDATTNDATANDATTNDASTNDAAANDAASSDAAANDATTNDAASNDTTVSDTASNNTTTGTNTETATDAPTINSKELEKIVDDAAATSATVTEITKKETKGTKVVYAARSIAVFTATGWDGLAGGNAENTLRIHAVNSEGYPITTQQTFRLVDSYNTYAPSADGEKTNGQGFADISYDQYFNNNDYDRLGIVLLRVEVKGADGTWRHSASFKIGDRSMEKGIGEADSGVFQPKGNYAFFVSDPSTSAKWMEPASAAVGPYSGRSKTPRVAVVTLDTLATDGLQIEAATVGGGTETFTYAVKTGAQNTLYNGTAAIYDAKTNTQLSGAQGTVQVVNGVLSLQAGQYAKLALNTGDAFEVTQTNGAGGYDVERAVFNGQVFTGETATGAVQPVDAELNNNRITFLNRKMPTESAASAAKSSTITEVPGEKGAYDITLSMSDVAGEKGASTGADVILVLDLSASMLESTSSNNGIQIADAPGQRWYDMKEAAHSMIGTLLEAGSRVAIVGYGGSGTSVAAYDDAILISSNGFSESQSALDGLYYQSLREIYKANTGKVKDPTPSAGDFGGVRYGQDTIGQAGLIAASELLMDNKSSTNQQYVVFMTDGEMSGEVAYKAAPVTGFAAKTIYSAKHINAMFPTAKIYTVGFGTSAGVAVLNPNGVNRYQDKYFPAGADINDAFQKIVGEITTQSSNMKIVDPMSDYVTFAGIVNDDGTVTTDPAKFPTGVAFDTTTKTLTWAPGSISANAALTYRVKAASNLEGATPPTIGSGDPTYGDEVTTGDGFPANKKTTFSYTTSFGSSVAGVELSIPRVPTQAPVNNNNGTLTITKESAINAGFGEQFTFVVTRDNGVAVTGKYTVGSVTKDIVDGKVILKAGETATLTGLSVAANSRYTEYTVQELENTTFTYDTSYTLAGSRASDAVSTIAKTTTAFQLMDGVPAALTFKNEPKGSSGIFVIQKTAKGGNADPDNNAEDAKAKFTFTVKVNGQVYPLVYTYQDRLNNGPEITKVLDANGQLELGFKGWAQFKNVPNGAVITVEETPNPNYPVKGELKQEKTMNAASGNGVSFIFVNNKFVAPTLQIVKQGEVRTLPLGSAQDPAAPMQALDGVTFKLWRLNESDPFQTLVTDAAGKASYQFKSGESGTYVLAETLLSEKWDSEYKGKGDVAIIEVSPSGEMKIKQKDAATWGISIEGSVITVTNELVDASVTMEKRAETHGGELLSGAIFALYDKDKTLIREFPATDKDNIRAAKISNLPRGIYYYKEIVAPLGYQLDSTMQKIELDKTANDVLGGWTAHVTVPNERQLASIIIYKVNESGAKLAGAEFQLYNAADDTVYTSPSGKSGPYLIENKNPGVEIIEIVPGQYYFKETKAPDGYFLDETKHAFEVVINETERKLEVKADGAVVKEGRFTVTNKSAYSTVSAIVVDKTAEFISGVATTDFNFTLTGTPDNQSGAISETAPAVMELTGKTWSGDAMITRADGGKFPVGTYKLTEGPSANWQQESLEVTVLTGGTLTTYADNEEFRIEANTVYVRVKAHNVAKSATGTKIIVNESISDFGKADAEKHDYTLNGPSISNLAGTVTVPKAAVNTPTAVTWGDRGTEISGEIKFGEYKLSRVTPTANEYLVLESITVQVGTETKTYNTLSAASILVNSASAGKTITVTLNYKVADLTEVTVTKALEAGKPVSAGDTFTVTFTEVPGTSTSPNRPISGGSVTLPVGGSAKILLQKGMQYSVTETQATGSAANYTLVSMAETAAGSGNTFANGVYTLNGTTGTLLVTNKLTSVASLTITKAIANNNGTPLNAADTFTFKVWRADLDESTAETVTMKAGESKTLTALNANMEYSIREVLAADANYSLASITGAADKGNGVWSATPVVGQGGTSVTANNNVKMGTISILKVDSATGAKLAGATFLIKNAANAADAGISVTTGTAAATASVPVGTYNVTETKAPDGYTPSTKTYSVTVTDGATVEVGEAVAGNQYGVPNTFKAADGTSISVTKTLQSGEWLADKTFEFELRNGATQVGKASITLAANSKTGSAVFTNMDGSKLTLAQGTYYITEKALTADSSFNFISITGTDKVGENGRDGNGAVDGNAYKFTVDAQNNTAKRVISVEVTNAVKTSGADKAITAEKVLNSGAAIGDTFTINVTAPDGTVYTGTTMASGAVALASAAGKTLADFTPGTYTISETATTDSAWTKGYALVNVANASDKITADADGRFTLKLADISKSWKFVVTNEAKADGSIVLTKTIKDGEKAGVIVDPNEEFEFTLKKGTTDVALSASMVTNGTVRGGKLYVKPGTTATITGLTLGEEYTLTETTTGHTNYTFTSINRTPATDNTGNSLVIGNMAAGVPVESISNNKHTIVTPDGAEVVVTKTVSGTNQEATPFIITFTPEKALTNATAQTITLTPAVGASQSASGAVELIYGVKYSITEALPAGGQYLLDGITVNSAVANTIIPSATKQTVAVTNKMKDSGLNNGSVTAAKAFEGGNNGLGGTFGIVITGQGKTINGTATGTGAAGNLSFTLDTFTSLPMGNYTVREVISDAETAKLFEQVSVSVVAYEGSVAQPAQAGTFTVTTATSRIEITVTNKVKTITDPTDPTDPDNAKSLSVDKAVAQGAGLAESFEITLADSDASSTTATTAGGAGVITLPNARLGYYTIRETFGANWQTPTFKLTNDVDDTTITPDADGKFLLGADAVGKNWTLTVTNTSVSNSEIVINKTIGNGGYVVPGEETFSFTLTDKNGNIVKPTTGITIAGGTWNADGTIVVTPGQQVTISGLPTGESFIVTETPKTPSSYTAPVLTEQDNETNTGNPITVVTKTTQTVVDSVSNNLPTTADNSSVTLTKTVQAPDLYPGTASFQVKFEATDANNTKHSITVPVTSATAGAPVAGLITGLTYTVTEPTVDTRYELVSIASGAKTDAASITLDAVSAATQAVTVTNKMADNATINGNLTARKIFTTGTNGLTDTFELTITGPNGTVITGSTNGMTEGGLSFNLNIPTRLPIGTYTVVETNAGTNFVAAPYTTDSTNIAITVNGTALAEGVNTFEVTDATTSVSITARNSVKTLGEQALLTLQKELANGVGVVSTFTLNLAKPNGSETGTVASTAITAVNTPVNAITISGTALEYGTYTITERVDNPDLWDATAVTYRLTDATGNTLPNRIDENGVFTLGAADVGKALNVVVTNKTMDNGSMSIKKLLRTGDVDVDSAMFKFQVLANGTAIDLTGRIDNLGPNVAYNADTKTLSIKAGATAQLTGFTIGAGYVVHEIGSPANYAFVGIGKGTTEGDATITNVQEISVTMDGTKQNVVSVSRNKNTTTDPVDPTNPTDPNTAGVTLTKNIANAGLNAAASFTVTFTPEKASTNAQPVSATVTVPAGAANSGAALTVPGLIYGMTYTASEAVPTGYTIVGFGGDVTGVTADGVNSAKVKVETGKVKDVTVTNKVADKSFTADTFKATKTITSNPGGVSQSFALTIKGTDANTNKITGIVANTAELSAASTGNPFTFKAEDLKNLPVGEYSVRETTIGENFLNTSIEILVDNGAGGISRSYQESLGADVLEPTFVITEQTESVTITVTNTVKELDANSFTVMKQVTGAGLDGQEFTISVTGQPTINGVPTTYAIRTVYGTNAFEATENMPVGTYTVTEGFSATAGGWVNPHYALNRNGIVTPLTGNTFEITASDIDKENNRLVLIVTNSTQASGSLTINKEIDGTVVNADDEFTFMVEGPNGYLETVKVKAGESKTLSNLKLGETYTVTETVDSNSDYTFRDITENGNETNTTSEVSGGKAVLPVRVNGTNEITSTSTNKTTTGNDAYVTLAKVVSSTPNLYPDTDFTVVFTAKGNNTVTKTIRAGATAINVDGLLYGLEYAVTETLPEGTPYENTSISHPTVTVTEDTKATAQNVVVTNALRAAGINNVAATKVFAGATNNISDEFSITIEAKGNPAKFSATGTATTSTSGTSFSFGPAAFNGIAAGTYTVTEAAAKNYLPAGIDGNAGNIKVVVTQNGVAQAPTYNGEFSIDANTTAVDITVQNTLKTFNATDAAVISATETVTDNGGASRSFTYNLYNANTTTRAAEPIATATLTVNGTAKTNVPAFAVTAAGTAAGIDLTKLPYGTYTMEATTADAQLELTSATLNSGTEATNPSVTFTVNDDAKTANVDYVHTVKTSDATFAVEKLLSGAKNIPAEKEISFTIRGAGDTYNGKATFDAETEQTTVAWTKNGATVTELAGLKQGVYTLTETNALQDFTFEGMANTTLGGTPDNTARTFTFTVDGTTTGKHTILSTSSIRTDAQLTVTKAASDEASTAYFTRNATPFTFALTGTNGTVYTGDVTTVTVGGTVTFTNLPRGQYTVEEMVPADASYTFEKWENNATDAQRTITLDAQNRTQALTATNKALVAVDAPFSLTKTFDVNGLTYNTADFTFTLTPQNDAIAYNGVLSGTPNADGTYHVLWTVAGAADATGARELTLPYGTYTLTEASANASIVPGGFTNGTSDLGASASTTIVVDGNTTNLAYSVKNVVDSAANAKGALTLNKTFAFNGTAITPPYAESFEFTVYNWNGTPLAEKLVLNEAGGYTASLANLAYGVYTVKETSTSTNYTFGSWNDATGATTGDTHTFTVDAAAQAHTATATNNVNSFNANKISVSELISELGAETPASFAFNLLNGAGETVSTATVALEDGRLQGTAQFTAAVLPLGRYTVTVTPPAGQYVFKSVSIDGATGTIADTSNMVFDVTGTTQEIKVNYEHTLNTNTGKLTFRKNLVGAENLNAQAFEFTLSGQNRFYEGTVEGAGDITWMVDGNPTTTLTGLPVGSYTVAEAAYANFNTTIASDDPAFGTVNGSTFAFTLTENANSDHVITFTNTAKADGVVTVTNTAPTELGNKTETDYDLFTRKGTSFTYTLTPKGGGTPYTQTAKVGETVSFENLPYGEYTLEETIPTGAIYSFDSWTDGGTTRRTVTVQGNAGNSFTAVNIAHFGSISITKESSRGGKLSATFQIVDSETNQIVDTIVTDATTGFAGTKLLPVGTYVVHESIVPANHTAAADVTVTLTENNEMIVRTIVNTYKTSGGGDSGGGNGGGNGGGTPDGGGNVNIPDSEIPLAAIPEELKEIPDEQIPLANLPNTGGFAAGSLAIIGTILLGIGLKLRRKSEQQT